MPALLPDRKPLTLSEVKVAAGLILDLLDGFAVLGLRAELTFPDVGQRGEMTMEELRKVLTAYAGR